MNLREYGRLYCDREFGAGMGDEFADQYDKINQGIPIGGFVETAAFIHLVEQIKKDKKQHSFIGKTKGFFKK